MNDINCDNKKLAAELVRLCAGKHIRVSTAESCTGGLICAYITAVPGASEVTHGSIVSYANRVKNEFLGVPSDVLSSVGAVSAECVEHMAAGVIGMFGSDVGIAVSGIAGPGGGSAEKPVGTVYICVRYGNRVFNKRFGFEGDRDSVREQTARRALAAAIEIIKQ